MRRADEGGGRRPRITAATNDQEIAQLPTFSTESVPLSRFVT